jgi:hypothetical protein
MIGRVLSMIIVARTNDNKGAIMGASRERYSGTINERQSRSSSEEFC